MFHIYNYYCVMFVKMPVKGYLVAASYQACPTSVQYELNELDIIVKCSLAFVVKTLNYVPIEIDSKINPNVHSKLKSVKASTTSDFSLKQNNRFKIKVELSYLFNRLLYLHIYGCALIAFNC